MEETVTQAMQIVSSDEGYRQFVYLDSRGMPTIGHGRNLKTKGVSKEEADYLLKNDICEAIKELMQALPWFPLLCVPRQVVLVDMCINLGFQGLMLFKNFLFHLQHAQYAEAALDLRQSEAYKQLTNRYERLAKIIEGGNYVDK